MTEKLNNEQQQGAKDGAKDKGMELRDAEEVKYTRFDHGLGEGKELFIGREGKYGILIFDCGSFSWSSLRDILRFANVMTPFLENQCAHSGFLAPVQIMDHV